MKDFFLKILRSKNSLLISLLGGFVGVALGTLYEKILPFGVTLSLIIVVGVLIGFCIPTR
jgi:hypothetical protein